MFLEGMLDSIIIIITSVAA